MKKSVGILTLYYAYNYGSVLQTFALQNKIASYGYEVHIINYISRYDYVNYQLFRWQHYVSRPRELAADLVYFRKNYYRRKSFLKFQKSHLNISGSRKFKGKNMRTVGKAYTCYVTGSDQVWNFKCTGGVDEAYFLDFVKEGSKKIAYAPSMGELDQQTSELQAITPLLRKFNFISIREKSTQRLVSDLYGADVPVTCDPTLLLEAKDYKNLIVGGENANESGHYLFVYLLEPNQKLLTYVENLAREKGLKVIYISNIVKKNLFTSINSENAFGISPELFLQRIVDADYVVTNSFHATIFSILFKKKFVTFKTKKSFPRMMDLLETLGIQNRIFNDHINISDEIDFSSVEKKMQEIRKQSLDFLQKALVN